MYLQWTADRELHLLSSALKPAAEIVEEFLKPGTKLASKGQALAGLLPIAEILKLGPGAVVELEESVGSPVELVAKSDKDAKDCDQKADDDLRIAGCTRVLNAKDVTDRIKAIGHSRLASRPASMDR